MTGHRLIALLSLAFTFPAGIAHAQQAASTCAPGIDLRLVGIARGSQTRIWIDGRLEFDSGEPADPPEATFLNLDSQLDVPNGDHVFRIASPAGDFTRTLRITDRDRMVVATSSNVEEEAIYLQAACTSWTPN